ncbi:unnamed protein product [Chilo suppressalis]|uniref:C2H2-type domain-containing protein n=1 Tax=Chilo suppressalis TaxID=168631 RepID=A0ABN8BAV7_CHISP|nr:unnamed protein product [Chilo suppressalis]
MSAKLLIHKFETGFNFKSLQISIDDENDSSDTKFSEWADGRSFPKKKESEKLPRLVVKIVSGIETSNFNLDSCAKLINNSEFAPYLDSTNNVKNNFEIQQLIKFYGNEQLNYSQKYYSNNDEQSSLNNNDGKNILNETLHDTMSPLEYSLEKVKENNARIMENINMLNLTLNYTKKKETLDTICPKSTQSFPCDICGKCFVYETGLKRHYSIRHSIMESLPRWQIVWTCIECFQVWPQDELALKHSSQCCRSDTTHCIQEIKTSSLLQCEFCEKVYTSIPRLLKHAKMHTTENNYECNACDITFTSYKAAEEHWLLCPWLKTCYSFSLPKLLLCNACDRKFRNYEQLYNHRYKIGHFMAKYSNKSMGANLYQCELCGKCSTSTSMLQVHRQQSHPCHSVPSYDMTNNGFQSNYFTEFNYENYINKQI